MPFAVAMAPRGARASTASAGGRAIACAAGVEGAQRGILARSLPGSLARNALRQACPGGRGMLETGMFETGMSEWVMSGHARAVLFIHGIGGAGRAWAGQVASFAAAGFAPLAPDLPGYGGR